MTANEQLTTSAHWSFNEALAAHGLAPLTRAPLAQLQVNLGRLCNQACHHCHVDAGPKRTEMMSWETMERILTWTQRSGIRSVDLTGGAPETNPHFRRFVDGFLALGCEVTARCNLTVLLEPGQEDLAAWYAARAVRLVCSLPCYTRENVDAQRGRGVFDKSIEALKRLNALGYGRQVKETARSAHGSPPSPCGRRDGDEGPHPHSDRNGDSDRLPLSLRERAKGEGGRPSPSFPLPQGEGGEPWRASRAVRSLGERETSRGAHFVDSGRGKVGEPQPRLVLDLVYNPGGAFLPGDQSKLEADYRRRLGDEHGIVFNHLLTLANLPINRFAHWLEREGKYDTYMQLLRDRFNPATVDGLMCRHLLSVDWLGRVYDCDFNQMLDLPLAGRPHRPLWEIDAAQLAGQAIAVGPHCLGCTAGCGSSCSGALA